MWNARLGAGFSIKTLRYAPNVVLRGFTFADERFLARVNSSSPRQVWTYLDKPVNTPAFAAHLRKKEEHLRFLSMERADLLVKKIRNQYAAVRGLAPGSIVETGLVLCPLSQLAVCRENPGLAETVVGDQRQ